MGYFEEMMRNAREALDRGETARSVEMGVRPMLIIKMVGSGTGSASFVPLNCDISGQIASRIREFVEKDLSYLVIYDTEDTNLTLDSLSTTEPVLRIVMREKNTTVECPVDTPYLKEMATLLENARDDGLMKSDIVHIATDDHGQITEDRADCPTQDKKEGPE